MNDLCPRLWRQNYSEKSVRPHFSSRKSYIVVPDASAAGAFSSTTQPQLSKRPRRSTKKKPPPARHNAFDLSVAVQIVGRSVCRSIGSSVGSCRKNRRRRPPSSKNTRKKKNMTVFQRRDGRQSSTRTV